MKPILVATAGAIIAIGFAAAAVAQAVERGATTPQTEFSAQKKKKAKRAPVRIRVQRPYPYYRNASEFPRADEISYPGPNAVRQCRSWLAQEYRPSGTVIVPRMRCWWERG
ncbi:MAG: hypothetical protein ACRECO_06085 [Xanthobacteraceae bacterium]